MKQYILRRLLLFVPVLLGVTVIIFGLLRLVPGDVALQILIGPDGTGQPDKTRYERIRRDLHLDRSVFCCNGSQYGEWIYGMVRGDWGKSIQTNKPVLAEIKRAFPVTFELATLTMVVSVLIALPLGILMAIKQDSALDYSARMFAIAGIAMPSFWLGALTLLVLTVWFHWLPPLSYVEFWDNPWTNLQQIIWAALALGYLFSAVIARMTRSTLLEVLRQDYIRTAWSKGLQQRTVIMRHALKNAILPVVTIIGLYYSGLIGGTVIMEQLWNLPGLGRAMIGSINFRDYPMVQGLGLFLAIMVVTGNLLIDILYAWLDPRIRYS